MPSAVRKAEARQPVFGDLFVGEPLPENGRIRLGDAPGFGMDLRDGAMLVQVR